MTSAELVVLGDFGLSSLPNVDFIVAAETIELMLSLRSRLGLSSDVVRSVTSPDSDEGGDEGSGLCCKLLR